MPLSVAAVDAVIKPLPRALSLAAALAAAAATSLLLISAVVSRARDEYASPPPPSTSASTTAALPPAPEPSPSLPEPDHPHPPPPPVPPCPPNASHLVPCHEPPSDERHCPPRPPHPPPHPPKDPPPPPHCRVPPPPGYHPPPPWPERRESARYANADLPPLTAAKLDASKDPVGARGEWLVFPKEAGNYVEQLERVVPLRGGAVRTALDIGCGYASFGDYLLSYDILTMSIAPRDTRDAQVQFSLERGLPAMIGALGARRLPYPSRSFDMVHCADCHVPWTAHDGMHMLEIDRLLRPGGYWVLSGPPISWKSPCKDLNSTTRNLDAERLLMEDIANKLCWEKVSDKGSVSVWRKPTNHLHCAQEAKYLRSLPLCTEENPDSAWYVNISVCRSHLPRIGLVGDIAGGVLKKWPQRLVAVPPRITNGEINGMSIKAYKHDYSIWKRRVELYGTYLKDLSHGSYRNVMDMNAGFGGFAAAMSKYPVWVMNVVPANTTDNTLGVIYERGLIGTYMDWCEAFSTYPRTYDLIHANGVFSLYTDKCGILDILVEMDRILQPGGAAIIRDAGNVVLKVKEAADQLQWHNRVVDTENGASGLQKLLIVDNSLPLPGR